MNREALGNTYEKFNRRKNASLTWNGSESAHVAHRLQIACTKFSRLTDISLSQALFCASGEVTVRGERD